MKNKLSVMICDVAREESEAAERDFPYSESTLNRIVWHVRRRRVSVGAALAAASGVVVGAVILGVAQFQNANPISPGDNPSPSVSPSATPNPSVAPSPSPTATQPIVTPPPPPVVSVPGAVSGLSAGPGGGSGEIVVNWTGTSDATGYRVYRSSAPGGPMTRGASYSLATGSTTVEFAGAYEFIQIWAPSASTFEYVEAVDGQPGYFVVVAFNSAGEGPRAGAVCAVPTGSSGTC